MGAFVAFYFNRKNAFSFSLTAYQILSFVGLLLVAYSIFTFDEHTPFPSLYTLFPTVGVVLLILCAREGTFVNHVLCNRLLVGIGLISYSAYLWHQPLFAFAKYRSLSEPSMLMMLSLCAVTFPLGYFSWRYVEKPIRQSKHHKKETTFIYSFMSVIILSGTGILFATNIFLSKFELENPYEFMNKEITEKTMDGVSCRDFEIVEGSASCMLYGEGENLVVIWGDSHAQELGKFVPEVLLPEDTRLLILAHNACPPIAGVVRADKIGNARNCSSINTLAAYADFILSKSPKTVVFVGRWTLYLRGLYRKGVLQKQTHFIALDEKDTGSEVSSQAAFIYGMAKTLQLFSDSDLYVVGQPPELNHLNGKSILLNKTTDRKKIDNYHSVEEKIFGDLKNNNVTYINMRDVFCDKDECDLRINQKYIYKDDNHLKGYGLLREWNAIGSVIFSETH